MAIEVLNRETLINEIWRNKGKVSLVAERLGVTSRTIYNYAEKYATVQTALDDAHQHSMVLLVDTAETKVQHSVLEGERWAVLHTLNNSPEAKRRGWGPRHEVTGADGGAMKTENHVSFDYSKLSAEQLAQLIAIAESATTED